LAKIVIVGAGNMAREHLKAMTAMPHVEIAGIYSRTTSRSDVLAQEFSIDIVADSIADLYEKTRAHGVVIAVNELSTEEVCSEAMAYPWQLLVEKPIGLDLKSTRRILAVADSAKSHFYVAMNRRHYSSTLAALKILESLDAARVVQVFDQEDPSSALKVGRTKQVCDQWHFANSIHLIDLFHVFCRGAPVTINNLISWRSGYDPKATHSIINFDSGDTGIYHSVWNAPGPWAVAIETPQKRLEMRPLESLVVQSYPARNTDKVPVNDMDLSFKPGFFRQMDQFVKALTRESFDLLTLGAYCKSAQLTHELYREDI